MRGRCLMILTAALLGYGGGCSQTASHRQPETSTGFAKIDESKPLQHKAPTYCAFGDMVASVAVSEKKTPEERRQAREEAKLSYLKAIEIDPTHLVAYVSLARVQQLGEEYEEAISTYGKALDLSPTEPALWHDLALCQCRMKQWEAGIASLQRACELDPSNRTYQTTLGYVLGRAGRTQESLAVLIQVRGEAKAYFDLARMMHHVNQVELAKQYAETALAKDPNLVGAKQFLIELNQSVGTPHYTVSTNNVAPGLNTATNAAGYDDNTALKK